MILSETIKSLLHKRGIHGEEEIEEFLSQKPQKTYDPLLLPDMEVGVDFLLSEIDKGSKVCIYGDYDADGITATSLLLDVLGHIMPKEDLDFYIPSRFDEGYGLNMEAVKIIAERGFQVIVTVDCGSVSANEVEYAKELGLKVLVTDHHTITDVMADCLIINPKKKDNKYPFPELCGCGVAFKFAQMIQKKRNLPKSVLTGVLDLVAIGTIGDVMPLLDENRTICKFGLQMMNSGKRYGLQKLIEALGLKLGTINSGHIGYLIVPHLNASGRIENASRAVQLLTLPKGDPMADEIVNELIWQNRERKRLQNETYEDCMSKIDRNEDFVLIKSENAHEGIAGIVAGKIKDSLYRPTVLVTPSGEDGQYLKGSGRSIEGIDLYQLLKKQESLFEKFGGHKGACGFLMKKEDFDTLKSNLLFEMEERKAENPCLFIKKYPVDLDLDCGQVSLSLVDELRLLEPFGNKNPKPLFQIKNVGIQNAKTMGSDGKHASFVAVDSSGEKLSCILFQKAGKYGDFLFSEDKVNLIGTVEEQIWQGVRRIQFQIEEIYGENKFD